MLLCRYEPAKDKLLREKRQVSFEDVIEAIEANTIRIVPNPKPGREHQLMVVFLHNGYPHLCPFVIEEDGGWFLKTIHPDRNYKYLFDNTNKNEETD